MGSRPISLKTNEMEPCFPLSSSPAHQDQRSPRRGLVQPFYDYLILFKDEDRTV